MLCNEKGGTSLPCYVNIKTCQHQPGFIFFSAFVWHPLALPRHFMNHDKLNQTEKMPETKICEKRHTNHQTKVATNGVKDLTSKLEKAGKRKWRSLEGGNVTKKVTLGWSTAEGGSTMKNWLDRRIGER